MDEISQELHDLAFFALDSATESVVLVGGPLIPFAITENAEGGRALTRFFTERLLQGLGAGLQHVRNAEGAVRAVVAYDGYLTMEGKRSDAVYVAASEVNSAQSIVLAQRYRKLGLLRRKIEAFGNPVFTGYGNPLL
jgi:hypothetical protein